MSPLEQALAFDARDEPVEAARAYEAALAAGDADLDACLNLAVLLFVCNDGGYAAHHRLSVEFLEYAWARTFEVFDSARHRWGWRADVEFWERYFRFIVLGEPPLPEDLCEALAAHSITLEPYMFLCSFTPDGRTQYLIQAKALLDKVRTGSTTRQRYVRSVLHPEPIPGVE